MNVLSRLLSNYRLPSRGGRIIAMAVAVYASSSGLYLAGGTVYFVRVAGLSSAQIGAGLTVAGLVGFLTTVPVSLLANRWGPLQLLRLLQLSRAACFVALAFSHDMVAFTLFASLFAVSQGPMFPMVQLVVNATVGEENRTRTLGVITSVINVGMSVGALAAAPFLAVGSPTMLRTVLLIGGACCVGSAGLFGLLRVGASAPVATRPARWHTGLLSVGRDHRYLALTVANGVLFLHTVLLSIGLPLWLVRSTNAPIGLLSALFAVNTALTIVFQVHVAKRVDSSRAGTRALRYAGFALAAFSLLLIPTMHSGVWLSVGLLVAATVVLTGGELFQSAGGWELSYRHAAPGQQSEYLSVFSLGGSAAGVVGPALLAWLLSHGAGGLFGLAGLFLVTSGAVTVIGGRLARAEQAARDLADQVAVGAESASPGQAAVAEPQ